MDPIRGRFEESAQSSRASGDVKGSARGHDRPLVEAETDDSE
jgi:hypothetical protein